MRLGTRTIKTCKCGAAYTESGWAKLHKVGEMPDGEGGLMSLRNCRCGSTLAVELVIVIAAMLGALGIGCASPTATDHKPTPAVVTYHVDSCGNGAGWKSIIGARCEGDGAIQDVSCEIDGGPNDTSLAYGENGWECGTTWDDSVKGGTLCVHLTCRGTR